MSSANVQFSSTDEVNKSLINIFCKRVNGFNVVHFNARSLNSLTVDYIRNVFENSSVDIICVTETWLNADISDSKLNINGYTLFRKDRCNGKRGGGVAIYCKKYINAKIVNFVDSNPIESINLDIKTHEIEILVSCVYNPDKSNDLGPFFNAFATQVINYDYVICCGDFNVNLLSNEAATSEIFNMLSLAALSVVNSILPTRYCSRNAPSLLDYFAVSDLSKVLFFNQIDFVSDHDLIFCTFNLPIASIPHSETFQFRDFSKIDYNALYTDTMLIPWKDCWSFSNVNDKLEFFTSCVNYLYELHVPISVHRVVNKSCPWFTTAVKKALKKRSTARNKWKKNPNESNWTAYKQARNDAMKIVRNSKAHFCKSRLNASLPPKILWKNLKKFGVCDNGNSNCDLSPNDLNNYFVSACSSMSVRNDSNYINADCKSTFEFSVVNEVDVLRKISSIKSNAVGCDGMSLKFLKIILPYIIAPITHIINFCIVSSTFPSIWKEAIVVPVEKKSSPSVPEDYRPISILPILAKVTESLLSDQIVEYFNHEKLLHPMQSAFRAGHSCTTANIKVLDDIRKAFDKNMITLLCFLDFIKAFDSVNHKILIKKLKSYGFCDTSLKLIISYLNGRSQRVKIGNSLSDSCPILSGVPQGSVLGPILFTIFINDIFSVCEHVCMHAYADDIQLYISRPLGLIEDMCARLNEDLAKIHKWSEINSIRLNPVKSFVMPISPSSLNFNDIPAITIGNNDLSFVRKIKSLGIMLNSELSATDHINYTIKKIYFVLRNLRFSADFTPKETRIKLVKQLILPHVDFFANIYCKLDSSSLKKLTVALNNSARYVFNLSKYERISDRMIEVFGCELKIYLNVRNCLFLRKLLLSKSPSYLYDKISFFRSDRNKNLIMPHYHYIASERLFFVSAARLWNKLPNSIRMLRDSGEFKVETTRFLVGPNN